MWLQNLIKYEWCDEKKNLDDSLSLPPFPHLLSQRRTRIIFNISVLLVWHITIELMVYMIHDSRGFERFEGFEGFEGFEDSKDSLVSRARGRVRAGVFRGEEGT